MIFSNLWLKQRHICCERPSNAVLVGKIPEPPIPYFEFPAFHGRSGLWLYGNTNVVRSDLAFLPMTFGRGHYVPSYQCKLREAVEECIFDCKVMVCGAHNPAHHRHVAAVVIRWGAPMTIVFSGGFRYHLGPNLNQEGFREAKLGRYGWDPDLYLAVSRRSPDKLPTYARCNPTIDRLAREIARRSSSL